MVYSTPDEVKLIIETSMSDDDITLLIVLADDEVDGMGGAALSDVDKQKCSMYLTAIMIAEKQPSSYSVGTVRINMRDRTARWLQRVKDIIDENRTIPIKSSTYEKIDEDARYVQG